MSRPVLSTEALCVRYGGVPRSTRSTWRSTSASWSGLIGANGAGKTTFIDAITGFTRPGPGVRSTATTSPAWSPTGGPARGLARTWQSTELFDDLTVRENLAVACGLPSARPS